MPVGCLWELELCMAERAPAPDGSSGARQNAVSTLRRPMRKRGQALRSPHIVFALDAVGQNVSGLERETSSPGKEGHYMDHSFVRAQRKKRGRQKTKMSYENV